MVQYSNRQRYWTAILALCVCTCIGAIGIVCGCGSNPDAVHVFSSSNLTDAAITVGGADDLANGVWIDRQLFMSYFICNAVLVVACTIFCIWILAIVRRNKMRRSKSD